MQSRRPDPRPARTRATILEATHALVAEQGVAETTIAQVASRARVAVGSIYTHFVSKEGLVLELVWQRTAPALEALEAARAGRSPFERVTAVGDAILSYALQEPVPFAAMVGMRDLPSDVTAHEAGRSLLAALEQVTSHLRRDVQEAVALGGGVAEADADEWSVDDVIATILGLWTGVASAVARDDRFALPEATARRAVHRAALLVA